MNATAVKCAIFKALYRLVETCRSQAVLYPLDGKEISLVIGRGEKMSRPSAGLSANFVGLGANLLFGSNSRSSPKRKRPQQVVRAFSF
jgi:hypothetical protein